VLLESHFLFGLIDRTMAFDRYRALILPDDIRIDPELKEKLDAYVAGGGKLVLSGSSGLWKERDEFAFELGAEDFGWSPFQPPQAEPNRGHDFLLPVPELRAPFVAMPQVMYERSRRIRVTSGKTLGQIFDPYFNRTWEHFCSHQHTPNQPEASGYDCGVRHGPILYFCHPVFRHYRAYGAVAYREFVVRSLRKFLGEAISLATNLPSTARVTLTEQAGEKRHVLHLLYAPTVSRGGVMQLSGGNVSGGRSVEVIEDLPPLNDVEVTLRLPDEVRGARFVPSGEALDLVREGGKVILRVPRFSCHQMIQLER
jgi:hypothetical protein